MTDSTKIAILQSWADNFETRATQTDKRAALDCRAIAGALRDLDLGTARFFARGAKRAGLTKRIGSDYLEALRYLSAPSAEA